jgi:hypothetical protein
MEPALCGAMDRQPQGVTGILFGEEGSIISHVVATPSKPVLLVEFYSILLFLTLTLTLTL